MHAHTYACRRSSTGRRTQANAKTPQHACTGRHDSRRASTCTQVQALSSESTAARAAEHSGTRVSAPKCPFHAVTIARIQHARTQQHEHRYPQSAPHRAIQPRSDSTTDNAQASRRQ
eukprot:3826185-Pleurochrysis_carterae.AAC.3